MYTTRSYRTANEIINSRMHVTHLSASISRKAGGLFTSVRQLCESLSEYDDVCVNVLSLRDEYSTIDKETWKIKDMHLVSSIGPRSFGWAPDMKSELHRYRPDLLHSHGLWMYTSAASSSYASKNGVPYVVTPRGMLDPWAVRNSWLKKKIAAALYEQNHLENASCLHALCESEVEAIRKYGLTNPVCVIPNGVGLPDLKMSYHPPWIEKVDPESKVLLFLGRLHPKKGLAELIAAWGQVKRNEWEIVIIGWDDGGHEQALRASIRKHGLEGSVHLLGPKFGEEKFAALQGADAFILPSYSEGLPMAVLEAWSFCLPVLMTPECNIPEGFEYGAAIRVDADIPGIVAGLNKLIDAPAQVLAETGERGRRLVKKKFTWDVISEKMRRVYLWILGDGPRPECIYH